MNFKYVKWIGIALFFIIVIIGLAIKINSDSTKKENSFEEKKEVKLEPKTEQQEIKALPETENNASVDSILNTMPMFMVIAVAIVPLFVIINMFRRN